MKSSGTRKEGTQNWVLRSFMTCTAHHKGMRLSGHVACVV